MSKLFVSLAKMADLKTTMFVGTFTITLKSGKKFFVKVAESNVQKSKSQTRKIIEGEKIILKYLEGLAVPKLVDPSEFQQLQGLNSYNASVLIEEQIVGKHFGSAKLNIYEAIGSWLFVLEQFVAFRKHGILYTDIKSSNILCKKKPLKIIIVDLGGAIPHLKNNKYKSTSIPYTPGYQAPELLENQYVKESAIVYQVGMLLGSVVNDLSNLTYFSNGVSGCSAFRESLEKIDLQESTVDLILSAVDTDPKVRPQTILSLYRQLKKTELLSYKKIYTVWSRLRTPYVSRLKDLGLQ